MSSEHDHFQNAEDDRTPVTGAPDVHTFVVPPKSRTRETIVLIMTLAVLFLLLVLLVGHPAAPPALVHPHGNAPHAARTSH